MNDNLVIVFDLDRPRPLAQVRPHGLRKGEGSLRPAARSELALHDRRCDDDRPCIVWKWEVVGGLLILAGLVFFALVNHGVKLGEPKWLDRASKQTGERSG